MPVALVAARRRSGPGAGACRDGSCRWWSAAGLLDASANLMFAAGSQRGLVSVVAVLGSLYPVATVALAGAFLHERLGRLQAVGAGLALAGVVLIAAALSGAQALGRAPEQIAAAVEPLAALWAEAPLRRAAFFGRSVYRHGPRASPAWRCGWRRRG